MFFFAYEKQSRYIKFIKRFSYVYINNEKYRNEYYKSHNIWNDDY